jgi:TrmH family RNA methyltransferase
LEGPNLLSSACEAGTPIDMVFGLSEDGVPPGVEFATVTEAVLEYLSPTKHPRGPIAVVRIPPSGSVSRSCLVTLGVSDPGNMGTLIRSAAAFEMDVAVDASSTDPWSPKALRAGAGAHFLTTIETDVALADLVGRSYTTVAAVVRGGLPPDALLGIDKVAIVVGSEAHGLARDVAEAADLRVTIPMSARTESFNAGVAGTILAYEYAKGRTGAPLER